jgi:hypothetical protein
VVPPQQPAPPPKAPPLKPPAKVVLPQQPAPPKGPPQPPPPPPTVPQQPQPPKAPPQPPKAPTQAPQPPVVSPQPSADKPTTGPDAPAPITPDQLKPILGDKAAQVLAPGGGSVTISPKSVVDAMNAAIPKAVPFSVKSVSFSPGPKGTVEMTVRLARGLGEGKATLENVNGRLVVTVNNLPKIVSEWKTPEDLSGEIQHGTVKLNLTLARSDPPLKVTELSAKSGFLQLSTGKR